MIQYKKIAQKFPGILILNHTSNFGFHNNNLWKSYLESGSRTMAANANQVKNKVRKLMRSLMTRLREIHFDLAEWVTILTKHKLGPHVYFLDRILVNLSSPSQLRGPCYCPLTWIEHLQIIFFMCCFKMFLWYIFRAISIINSTEINMKAKNQRRWCFGLEKKIEKKKPPFL